MVASAFPAYFAAIQESSVTATVRAADGVRFVANGDSIADCTAQLVSYVQERCDYVLWTADSVRVRALIDADKPDAAIDLYFARVGQRWDEERLEITPW